MVASGRNIMISCFEARALVFFARTSHNSSPHKRLETPFLTSKRTKCLQKFLNGILVPDAWLFFDNHVCHLRSA